jgi:hypothetical protein
MAGSDWTYQVEKRADREVGRLSEHLLDEAIQAIEDLVEESHSAGMREIARGVIRILRVRPRPNAYSGMRDS